MDLRVEGGEEQQLLVGQGAHPPHLVHSAQSEVQRAVPLPDLYILHPSTQQSGHLPSIPVQHNLPHALSEYQHGIQVLVQKGVDAALSPPHIHLFQEGFQPGLGLPHVTDRRYAAAEPDNLIDAGVHQRHSLPDRPVEIALVLPQRHIATQRPKGLRLHPPHLRQGRNPRRGLFFSLKKVKN